ncbi:MAG: FMN-binding glutamate synthase family protein [Synergistales bacterium]|nr:FMN-binding glutamate synthase family protein [Synergistales bacterium]
MTYSCPIATSTNNTRLRTPEDISPFSGMCAVCTNQCPGFCEIGKSVTEGPEALYPTAKATSQAASEKDYPVDFSQFNINGRCFGDFGTEPGGLAYSHVDLSCELKAGEGTIKLKAPYVFPAIAKLNWKDYYAGAALAGVIAVIGEDLPTSDPDAVVEKGRLVDAPRLRRMHEAFSRYDRGYGTLVLQANPDDDKLGLLEYALETVGFESVELKVGQAAKGIQGMKLLSGLEQALAFREMGYEVYPDPRDPAVQEAHRSGKGEAFYKIGRLPDWDEQWLTERVASLRRKGARFVSVKTGPYRPADMARLMVMASRAGVDLVTVDAAGGGTGNSPIRMMNEWGYPPVYTARVLRDICEKMERRGMPIPSIALAGGIVLEDQVFKGLALGSPHINLVGMGRAPMAAAMVGHKIGRMLEEGTLPVDLREKGTSVEELFSGVPALRGLYGDRAEGISCGALGLSNYIQRVNTGLRQLMALCRKYSLRHLERTDLIPLTREAADVSGLPSAVEQDRADIDQIIG